MFIDEWGFFVYIVSVNYFVLYNNIIFNFEYVKKDVVILLILIEFFLWWFLF